MRMSELVERPLPGQEAHDARKRILEAAEALFAEHGFDGTSVQQITDAAHLNKAMLYYYFENKEHLYAGLIEGGLAALGDVLDEVCAKSIPPEQKLRQFLTAYCEVQFDKERIVRLIDREVAGGIESTRRVIKTHFLRNVVKLQEIIEEGIACGCLRPVNTAMTSMAILGMMNIFISAYFLTGKAVDIQAVVDHNLNLILDGMQRGEDVPFHALK